jgi:uncharacterized protein
MEKTIAQKLNSLVKLQNIDSKLTELKKVRGDLPEEVQDLEDEVIGYQTRLEKYRNEIKDAELEITQLHNRKKEAEKLIMKYKDQQMNVRNNREYDALSKEVETEELDMTLSDKKIRGAQERIVRSEVEIKATEDTLEDRNTDLRNKKQELNLLLQESEEEELKLLRDREKQSKNIEDRLLRSYNKIRLNAINGLAVVFVKRDACGGCFNIVPPQRQADVREKKKIIVCEHCGRILAGVEEIKIEEVVETKARTRAKAK